MFVAGYAQSKGRRVRKEVKVFVGENLGSAAIKRRKVFRIGGSRKGLMVWGRLLGRVRDCCEYLQRVSSGFKRRTLSKRVKHTKAGRELVIRCKLEKGRAASKLPML